MAAVLPAVDQGDDHGQKQQEAEDDQQQVAPHIAPLSYTFPGESLTDMERPFIWAHRGASAHAPENTLAAFEAAVACGADGIELDIHLSQDGVPVVIHDETVDRTTDGRGPVAALTWAQLQGLDAGSWFAVDYAGEPIPSLAEVLHAFAGQVRLNLEVKEPRAGLAVLELLADYPDADVVLSAFDPAVLARVRAASQTLPLAVLFDQGNWRRLLAFAGSVQACAFHPRADRVNRPLLGQCLKSGLPVHAWTVDQPALARDLVRAGVVGIFSNDPAALLRSA